LSASQDKLTLALAGFVESIDQFKKEEMKKEEQDPFSLYCHCPLVSSPFPTGPVVLLIDWMKRLWQEEFKDN
jgi:hypothetical protein